MKPTEAEIEKHYRMALAEIGDITPAFDEETGVWVFQHPLYNMEGHGDTPESCIDTYKRWLKEFIAFRLQGRLAPQVEARTTGRGGYRVGAGRPKGSRKDPTLRISLPADIATWLQQDLSHQDQVRRLMETG